WAPLETVRAVVGPVELGVAFVAADLVLTAATALAARQPRYLAAGVLFPLLRIVDATAVLRATLRRHRVGAAKVTVPAPRQAPERVPRPRRRFPVPVGWALWVAAAAA